MTQHLTIRWNKDNLTKFLYMRLVKEAQSRGCQTNYTTRCDKQESLLSIHGASIPTVEVLTRLVSGLGVEIESKEEK